MSRTLLSIKNNKISDLRYIKLVVFAASSQQFIEVIGFGQATDAVKEDEEQSLKIRLEPHAVASDISGRVVPLSIPQFANYSFTSYTERTISQEVEVAIQIVTDEAECEYLT